MSQLIDYQYENDTPIDDADEVLCLLVTPWGSQKEICIRRQKVVEPHVEIASYSCNHMHSTLDGVERFRITPAVIERLLSYRLVRGIPHIGYTDETTLALTAYGEEVAWEKRYERSARYRAEIIALLPAFAVSESDIALVQKRLAQDLRVMPMERLHKRLKQLQELGASLEDVRKALELVAK